MRIISKVFLLFFFFLYNYTSTFKDVPRRYIYIAAMTPRAKVFYCTLPPIDNGPVNKKNGFLDFPPGRK